MSEDRSDDSRTQRGGGSPGVPTGGVTSAPEPKKTDPKSPSEPGRVARDNTNLLDLPVTRLLLGWHNDMPAAVTRYRLWIPTDTGGVLTVEGPNGGTVELRRPFANVIKPAANKVSYDVKTGEFGEFFVIAR